MQRKTLLRFRVPRELVTGDCRIEVIFLSASPIADDSPAIGVVLSDEVEAPYKISGIAGMKTVMQAR